MARRPVTLKTDRVWNRMIDKRMLRWSDDDDRCLRDRFYEYVPKSVREPEHRLFQ
jgi:hypothetical protein